MAGDAGDNHRGADGCEVGAHPELWLPKGKSHRDAGVHGNRGEAEAMGVFQAWKAVPTDLIKKAFLTCGISNAFDASEDKLAIVHKRSQLTHEVDVDHEIQAVGFWGNNCQEPEYDEEDRLP
ncbi:unnamed protein product [Closterium sp. NIES-53]